MGKGLNDDGVDGLYFWPHLLKLYFLFYFCRCGNVAAILELDENLDKQFRVFEAAPHVCIYYSNDLLFFLVMITLLVEHDNLLQESRGVPSKKPAPDYFL